MKKILLLLLLVSSIGLADGSNTLLSLQTAEKLAETRNSPWLNNDEAEAGTLAIPDSHFSVGVEKPPIPDNPTYKDDTSLVKLGVKHALPLGDNAELKYQKAQAEMAAEQQQNVDKLRVLLRNVRYTWLQLYLYVQSAAAIQDQQQSVKQLLDTINAHSENTQMQLTHLQTYANNLFTQQRQLQKDISATRAELANFIGQKNAQKTLLNQLPYWGPPPPLAVLQQRLLQHPKLQADVANIYAGRTATHMAKEKTKPTLELGLNYSVRQDDMLEAEPRPSMIGLELSLKLPSKARHVNSNHSTDTNALAGAQAIRQLHQRQMFTSLTTAYNKWQNLSQRNTSQSQINDAKQAVMQILNNYTKTGNGIDQIIQAYDNELKLQLDDIRRQVSLMQARAELLYYE